MIRSIEDLKFGSVNGWTNTATYHTVLFLDSNFTIQDKLYRLVNDLHAITDGLSLAIWVVREMKVNKSFATGLIEELGLTVDTFEECFLNVIDWNEIYVSFDDSRRVRHD